jgi:hypothetical protein
MVGVGAVRQSRTAPSRTSRPTSGGSSARAFSGTTASSGSTRSPRSCPLGSQESVRVRKVRQNKAHEPSAGDASRHVPITRNEGSWWSPGVGFPLCAGSGELDGRGLRVDFLLRMGIPSAASLPQRLCGSTLVRTGRTGPSGTAQLCGFGFVELLRDPGAAVRARGVPTGAPTNGPIRRATRLTAERIRTRASGSPARDRQTARAYRCQP